MLFSVSIKKETVLFLQGG